MVMVCATVTWLANARAIKPIINLSFFIFV
jgi:hypothetical protein